MLDVSVRQVGLRQLNIRDVLTTTTMMMVVVVMMCSNNKINLERKATLCVLTLVLSCTSSVTRLLFGP